MRDLIKKTDEEIEAAFEEMGASICVEDLVFTKDTIDQFLSAAESYEEHGSIDQEDGTLLIEGAQPKKGDRRGDLYVVDFGEVRAAFR